MKKLLLSLSFVAALGMLVSCSKDDAKPSKVFEVTIDGDEFDADEIEGYIEDDEYISFGAIDDDDRYFVISFYVDDVDDEGDYDLEDGDVYVSYGDDDDLYFATEGEIDFTTLTDSRVECTFEGVMMNISGDEEIDFEDGVAKVSLEEED